MNPTVATFIKIASTLLTTCALGLSGCNLAIHLRGESLSADITALSWLTMIILVAHGVEGIIAASMAHSRQKNPLGYGIYTFFVGFVGLQELTKH